MGHVVTGERLRLSPVPALRLAYVPCDPASTANAALPERLPTSHRSAPTQRPHGPLGPVMS